MCFCSSQEDWVLISFGHLWFWRSTRHWLMTDVLPEDQQAASLQLTTSERNFQNYKILWHTVKRDQTHSLLFWAQEDQDLNTDAEHHFQWSKVLFWLTVSLHTALEAVKLLWNLSAAWVAACGTEWTCCQGPSEITFSSSAPVAFLAVTLSRWLEEQKLNHLDGTSHDCIWVLKAHSEHLN